MSDQEKAKDIKNVWKENLYAEINYWEKIISGQFHNKNWVAGFKKRASGKYSFPKILTPYLCEEGTTRILDVGAGPHSVIGPVNSPSPIKVDAVDPLSNEYKALLHKYNVAVFIETKLGEAEKLSEYGYKNYDIVYSRNALDHSYDPVIAIIEMVKVAKVGGTIYIEGNVNEGVNENYHGLHQWNFLPVDNGDLIIWRKGEAFSLRSALQDHAKIQASGKSWFNLVLRKENG